MIAMPQSGTGQRKPVPEPEDQQEEAEETRGEDDEKRLELVRLRRFVDNGKHLKRSFESAILSSDEIAQEVRQAPDAPFRWESYP